MTESVDVLIIAPDLPGYAHPGDAGADLVSAEHVVLQPGERALVGTGVSIALPDGFAAFVVPRSGLAAKHGITVVNAPGTVDAGYRGEVKVTLLNTDRDAAFTIEPGDRIAQLIVMPVARANFIPVDRLPGSARGTGGFGSTGRGALAHAPADSSTSTHGAAQTGTLA
ncbi:deoxyuridine 5'-triphosphate nucleotidohydrolase [Plantibacter sp. Leaf171]|uniref:dUTP diphosphatase n=1 Tax=unclassified Plantibacter TaxID=2624265 RepID=UPI0006F9700A|nr:MULTISPECIES: dUTP diphosphatase [unclassified Plantibacter]KQM15142.1 deoxyuridine 5'-triphosphate nucleotidohydrolase [Plantibacter sp. Leaf1]KQR58285.1 deoxyuridine 5'-triphosphate nucleotidohydrolase [Plantibacter sp. Leaf171]